MTWRRSWNRPSAIWPQSAALPRSPTTPPTGCGDGRRGALYLRLEERRVPAGLHAARSARPTHFRTNDDGRRRAPRAAVPARARRPPTVLRLRVSRHRPRRGQRRARGQRHPAAGRRRHAPRLPRHQRDITQRKVDESRIVYLAEHDPLTGLLSRQKFLEGARRRDSNSRHTPSGRSRCCSSISMTSSSSTTPTATAWATRCCARPRALLARLGGEGNFLARLGGDEFGLLLRGGPAERSGWHNNCSAPSSRRRSPPPAGRCLTASIGISGYPNSGRTSETLLAHADIAMSHSESLGHNRWHAYLPSDTDLDSMRRTVDWQAIIQHALETDGFFLDFQPIVHVSGEDGPAYFEALVRLRDAGDQTHTAARFIETAEHTGQIVEIDKWVLRRVVADPGAARHRRGPRRHEPLRAHARRPRAAGLLPPASACERRRAGAHRVRDH